MNLDLSVLQSCQILYPIKVRSGLSTHESHCKELRLFCAEIWDWIKPTEDSQGQFPHHLHLTWPWSIRIQITTKRKKSDTNV